MNTFTRRTFPLAALVLCALGSAPTQAQDAGQLNVICSVQAEWCTLAANEFQKATGMDGKGRVHTRSPGIA